MSHNLYGKFILHKWCQAGILSAMLIVAFLSPTVYAAAPGATIWHQPMTSDGLAAGYPFEAWIYLDKSPDPIVPGYAFPAGATFRFTFPQAFTPQSAHSPQAVLLHGWTHGAIVAPFTVGLDPQDPRTIVLKLSTALPVGPAERPGLKAIHLRWGPINPQAGDYPITVEYVDAGELSGKTLVIAHITPKPVPNVAAYNQLHNGRNENWQRVKAGQAASLPIDILVTLPNTCRSAISLRPVANGGLDILSDGTSIGTVTLSGVPVSLKPEPFGPGYSRLGIARFHVTAGSTPGKAGINVQLIGGTSYDFVVVVEK
jgi:hypothetical protein